MTFTTTETTSDTTTDATAPGCGDCGATAGVDCYELCPSALADLRAELDDTDANTPCCPTPQAAARSACGCWGSSAGSAWIGSAA